MKAKHDWANGWPGNYCKRCGMDDGFEAAICCPNCYIPCDEEETRRDPVIRLCPEHKAWVETPCIQTALILHPTERDPFGVLTIGQLQSAHQHAHSYSRGYAEATYTYADKIEEADYTDIRDFLMGDLWDMPYYHACAVALYMTSEHSEHSWLFRPIL